MVTFVDEELGGQGEALFLPKFRIVYSWTNDFLNQILWIGSVHIPCILHRAIGHCEPWTEFV